MAWHQPTRYFLVGIPHVLPAFCSWHLCCRLWLLGGCCLMAHTHQVTLYVPVWWSVKCSGNDTSLKISLTCHACVCRWQCWPNASSRRCQAACLLSICMASLLHATFQEPVARLSVHRFGSDGAEPAILKNSKVYTADSNCSFVMLT